MTKYQIFNTTGGAYDFIGEYEAGSPDQTLDIYAQDAGYKSWADMLSQTETEETFSVEEAE